MDLPAARRAAARWSAAPERVTAEGENITGAVFAVGKAGRPCRARASGTACEANDTTASKQVATSGARRGAHRHVAGESE